jgi:hypothetical protein
MFALSYKLDKTQSLLNFWEKESKRIDNIGLKIFGYFDTFCMIILLPVHLAFGVMLLRNKSVRATERYKKFAKIIREILGIRLFFLVGILFQKK